MTHELLHIIPNYLRRKRKEELQRTRITIPFTYTIKLTYIETREEINMPCRKETEYIEKR